MANPTIRAQFLSGLCAALACATAALGADIPAELSVDRVTVYRQGAVVTRTGTVEIPAGVNRLLIKGLPAAIETKNLRVSVGSAAVRLGEIEVERVNEGRFVSEGERELRRRVEQTADQRAAVQDASATAQLQLKLLDSLAANPTGNATKSSVDGANLGAVLAVMGANSAAARARVRESDIRMRELDRELEKLKADLSKVQTQSRQSTLVRTSVEANAASVATVSVAYTVPDAGWQWIYAARLDTSKKRIGLERQGQVQQGSGEDWKNVELTLTTAYPSGDVATPIVGSLFLTLDEPYQPRQGAEQLRQLSMPAMAAAAPRAQEVMVTGHRNTARVEATEYLADYRIPSRVTLLADRDPRLYPIAEDAFDVELTARVVPKAGRAAYLEATFTYQRDVPLDGGQMQFYRDGAYVGEAATQAFLPGAQVRMPFGADERIHVNIQDEPAQSAEHGVINKQFIKETRRRFDVTSYHPAPIIVEVIDRIPVSKHAELRVETLKGATEPTTKDADGKAGVLIWRFDAHPQKTVSIHQYYAVQYPRERQVSESEGGPNE